MKKLHMGTMSYGFDSMDEVAHQLAIAFGASEEYGIFSSQSGICPSFTYLSSGLAKHVSSPTGAQLATRGRRDMSSRVRDVVLSLALCHNARILSSRLFLFSSLPRNR
jgi:phospholipid-translocating ATPase